MLVEPVAGVQIGDFLEAPDGRTQGARTGVQDQLGRGDILLSDAHLKDALHAPPKTRVPAQEPDLRRSLQAATQAGPRLHHDAPGAVENRGKVDFHCRDAQAEHRSPARLEGRARRSEGGLRRRAAEVDARSAEVFAFGQGHLLPGARKGVREGNAGLPSSDDQDVVERHTRCPVSGDQ